MRVLASSEIECCHGGLTDKQTDSLLGKIGSYSANSLLLVGLYGLGFINLQAVLIGGALAPFFKVAGTYFVYENKDWVIEQLGDYYPLS